MNLSVIVPCYNAADTLGDQLEALANQEWSEPWEVIVVNNRSIDGSMEIARQYQSRMPNLRIVDASARQGQPFALNTGVEHASAEAVAFCDADDVVAPGYVAAMGEALQKYDFVACRLDIEKLNDLWLVAHRENAQNDHLPIIWSPPYLKHAGGCSLGVKRFLHRAVGGFDEAYPYLHDTDFCFKVQLFGVDLEFVEHGLLYVRFRDGLKKIYRQAFNYAEYNVALYKKYRAFGQRVPRAWRRYVRDWMRLIQQIARIREKPMRAILAWQLGWQAGLLKGSLSHRWHPPVYSKIEPENLTKPLVSDPV